MDRAKGEFDDIMLETLRDAQDRFARVETPLDKAGVEALRDMLQAAQLRLAGHLGGARVITTMRITDPDTGDPVTQGPARGSKKWLDNIPEHGKYRVWFRMHYPADVGFRKKKGQPLAAGGFLLLRLARVSQIIGRPASVLSGS